MLKRLVYLPWYGAVTMSTAVARFFLVNLLIRNLGAAEFGRWSLYEPAVAVLSQLALLGVNYGLIKQVNQDKLTPAVAVKALFLRGQPVVIAACAAVFVVCFRLDLVWPGPLFLSLLIYAESMFLLLFSSYRASASIGAFAASSLVKVLVLLTVLFLALHEHLPRLHRAEAVLSWSLAASLAGLVSGLAAVRLLHKKQYFGQGRSGESHARLYNDAVRYGLPLLVTGLLAMAIDFAGRYILDLYIDRSHLATYVVYVRLASIVEVIIIAPFSLWWPTERFRRLESSDGGRQFFRSVSIAMLAVLLAAAGTLWFASDLVVSWLAPGVPSNRQVALLLTFTMVARGMAYPLNVGTLREGKTHWNILGALAAAVVNVALCFLLIPRLGILGAAWAALFSQICYTVFLTMISQRLHAVPLPYTSMLALVIVAALLVIAVSRYLDAAPPLVRTVVFSSASLLVFTPIVLPRLIVKNGT
jgi:O-antigen/teichoic acid export membrane protein